MQQNQWKAASQQLLEHWRRSGISQIPLTSTQNAAAAAAWLEKNASALFPQPLPDQTSAAVQAPTQKTHPTIATLVKENAPSTTLSKPATPSPAPTATPAALVASASSSPSIKKPIANVPTLGKPGKWTTASRPVSERLEVLQSLNEEVIACRKCEEIVCRRQRTVFGVGAINARVAMFGEAPGADEDRVGEPFVGAAGQLLDKILVASGLKRPEVYILNALKCRPPGNRTPTEIEIENCRPFFESQLEVIQPEYIVCWGAVAVRAVLKSTESVGRLRGKFHAFRGAKVMVTYHPAYLLRNPDAKKLTWEDMKMLMKDMGIPIPVK